MENLINSIFPPKCTFCGKDNSFFCKACLNKCRIIYEGSCIVCDKPSEDGKTHKKCLKTGVPTQTICIFEYEGIVRWCISRSKYGPKEFMALKILAKEMANLAYNFEKDLADFTVVPIPVSKKREKTRGFNQVKIISEEIAKKFNLKIENSILTRKKETDVQHKHGREERFKNLEEAFTADPKKVSGKKIVLVDDILTSGATLLEAAKTLYAAGATEVKCFTLSKKLKAPITKSQVPNKHQ